MRLLITADPELPVPPQTYGGIERIVAGLITGMKSQGHTVGLLAHPESTAPVDRLYSWPGAVSQNIRSTVRNLLALKRAVQDFRPDIIHSFSRLAYMLPIMASSLAKVMSYQREPSLRTTTWARRLAGRSLQFTGCSESICQLGRRAGGDWVSIPNFVELNKFTFQPQVSDDAPLVFLSRIEQIKGAHVAIEVAKRTGSRLIIAGNHSDDGAHGHYWHEQILPHIHDRIEYIGPVDDMQKNKLLGTAKAMIVPIQWEEPFGIVFAESLACGTPVLSCPRGALPEIVRQGIDGFLERDINGLIAAVSKLNQLNRSDCRQRVEDRFSLNIVAKQYETIYMKMAPKNEG